MSHAWRLGSLVTIVAGTLVALGNAHGKEKSAAGVEVTIVNDCPKAIDARFVVLDPATKDDAATKAKVARSPVVRLQPRSQVRRSMVPYERLIVVRRDGDMSAWFETKEDAVGGTIRLGASCESISTEKGPSH
jgi:hypothetical protein